MKNRLYIFFILPVVLSLSVACTSYTPPISVPRVAVHPTISNDIDVVWRGVVRYFAEHNIPIENLDHSSYFVKTKTSPLDNAIQTTGGLSFTGSAIPLENEWCDCGTAKLGNVWGTTSRISVSYNVILNRVESGKTEVIINVFFNGVYLGKRNTNISGYDVQMPLQCVSRGKLEDDLLTYVQNFK